MIFVFQIFNSFTLSFAYDNSNANQGKVYTSPKVDTSIPDWFKPMDSDNLNDWLGIFPSYLQKYKTANQFLVIPAMGLITPIVEIDDNSSDYKTALAGKDFNYDKYLVDGPAIYPGTAKIWEVGNTFVFWHSNYWIGKAGNFKTVFRLTYNIQVKDTILVFNKQWETWKKYTYEVSQSRLVDETEVSVMLPDAKKKEITLSACRPIGTARQRRINRASLINEEKLNYKVDTTISTPLPTKQESEKESLLREIQNNQELTNWAKNALNAAFNMYTPWMLISGTSAPVYSGAEYNPQKPSITDEAKKAIVTAIQALINVIKTQ